MSPRSPWREQASVSALLARYDSLELSPEDAVEQYLERIAFHNSLFGAYVCVDEGGARKDAAESTRRWRNGTQRLLEGVPIAVKDLMDVRGLPTLAGSRVRTVEPSLRDATVVRRLREAGAIVLGKTHTEEFAFGSWGTNANFGTPLNPWSENEPLVPGGSSSGSAVAVAAGLAPWAIGTDTGGSVRGPAAFQGLVGYKPTPGRISCHGVMPLSPSLDCVGVLTHTVADAALFAAAVEGVDEQDSSTWGVSRDNLFSQLDDGVAGLRLAVLDPDERSRVSAEVLRIYDDVLQMLAEEGAALEAVSLPCSLETLSKTNPTMAAEAYARYGEEAENVNSKLSSAIRSRILAGKMDAAAYIRRQWQANDMLRGIERAVSGCHAMILPTMPFGAPPVSKVDPASHSTVLTRFVNQMGWCGIAVPGGLTSSFLPMSMQCVAPADSDCVAIRVARAIEKNRPPLPPPPMVERLGLNEDIVWSDLKS